MIHECIHYTFIIEQKVALIYGSGGSVYRTKWLLSSGISNILESRKKTSLLDYFKCIPNLERDRVKYVTMDMNEIYKEIIQRRFKNAIIAIDSFHVMKLMNDELDRLRRKVMKEYEDNKHSDEYHLLKHKNYVLFKGDLDDRYHYSRHFRIDMNETDYLDRILKIDPELTKAYQEIRRYYYFNDSFNDYSKDEALDYISRFIQDCISSENECLIKIAGTLNNWKEEIANSFIKYTDHNGKTVRLSNGKIEGKNSYIKKMLRLANGYSNFERFRNRAMYCENQYETYSKEKLPNMVKRHFPKKKRSD